MSSIETVFERIEGWLHPSEGKLLFRLAQQCKGRGAIVEIGSWKGKSTICLAHGSRSGGGAKVHAIDPHTGSPEHSRMYGEVWTFDEFRKNIADAGLADLVEPHVDFSTSVAQYFTEPVEVIFIDGLHEYEGVKADFDAWFPKVIEGGTIAFHDTTCWPGVLRLVTESVFKSNQFRGVRFTKSIVYGEKVAQNTAAERAANRLRLCLFRFHAWTDRVAWRLVHNYLDSRLTRALVGYVKKRRQSRVLGDVVPSGTCNGRG
jgi:predicted O-methyltransferase YrrM